MSNEAERDLRKTKIRQKIPVFFPTEAGAEKFCTIQTVIETARKQSWDILQTLKSAPDQRPTHPDAQVRLIDSGMPEQRWSSWAVTNFESLYPIACQLILP